MEILFQSSYTLDLLCFIDLLILDEGASDLSEDLEYFRNYLSYEGESSLAYLQKTLGKGQSLQLLIAPLLVADPEFSKLSLPELLVSASYLIKAFKASGEYEKETASYQRFLRQEAPQIISALAPIAADMERGGFKHYWFVTHLPVLRKRLKTYEDCLDWENLIQLVGGWQKGAFRIFVSNMAQMELSYLGNGYFMAACETPRRRIVKSLLEVAVGKGVEGIDWLELVEALDGKDEIKKAKSWGQSIQSYMEKNARLALEYTMKEKAGLIQNAQNHLLDKERGSYQLALLMYDAMKRRPMGKEPLAAYFETLLKEADLSQLHQMGKLKIA